MYQVVVSDALIFIQVPRTGSTSVVTALRDSAKQNLNCYRHEGFRFLRQFARPDTHCCCVVRNPFTHAISYFLHTQRQSLGREILLSEPPADTFQSWLVLNHNNLHLRQLDYITQPASGDLYEEIVIYRYEHDYPKLWQMFENLQVLKMDEMPTMNASIRTEVDLLEMYYQTSKTRDLVKRAREAEFELFGYEPDLS